MSSTDEVSLVKVWTELYKYKVKIILLSIIFFIAAVIITLQISDRYTAKVLLVSVSEEQGGLASLAKNFGGLASMAGIGLGQSAGPDKALMALEIMKSQKFINDFVLNNNLVVPLMASEGSKPVTYELIIDDELYDVNTSTWVREVKAPKTIEPTDGEIYEEFLDILTIEQDAKTGFIKISLEFYSPYIAKEWIDLLVNDINEKMKKDDKIEAEKSIDYLGTILKNTKNSSMQETFYQLLEEQTKTLMLTESRPQYIFKTIAPAIVPEKKSSPKRAIICIFSGFLGAFIAMTIILIRYFSNNE